MDRLDAAEICQLVIENSSEAVFRARDGVIEWMSPRISDIAGWTPDDLIGRTTVHLWHPDDRDAAIALRDGAARGEAAHGSLRILHRDGHFVWVDARVAPAAAGQPDNTVVGSIRLADARRVHEEHLADIEHACRLLAENAHDIIWTVDPASIVLSVTPGVEATLGWKPDDLVGTFLPALVHPDDRPRMAAYRREVHAGKRPGRIEFRVQARGGAWKWASVSGVRTGDDEAPVMVVSWRDIDELVREREIAERETERLRAVLDSSLDPRVILGAVRDASGQIVDFRFEDANDKACDAMGMSREHMIGQRLLDIFPGVQEAGLLDGYIRAVEFGEPFEVDDVPYANEIVGTTLRYDIRAHAVGDSLMYAWRDVTARSLAADETADAALHFSRVARHAADAVVRVENGAVTWAAGSGNPMLQFHVGDVLDAALRAMLDTDDHTHLDLLETTLAAGVPYRAIWHVTDAAGRGHAMVVRAEAMGGGADPRTDLVLSITDLTYAPRGQEVERELADLMNRYGDS